MYNLFFTLKFNLIFLSTTKHIEMDKGGAKNMLRKFKYVLKLLVNLADFNCDSNVATGVKYVVASTLS